ncbi:hypothetical protein MKQ70_18285 [Chitinophaga sedimenti]|uniref:hypothetical protein n=1 Tax=Chitinophaga sedimenti TaxID=2033606 RepID=UPI0020051DF7|nr:hypothetical protein [Chitinophaga sedimenti]MCK7556858.1 hypothetical protein [Chitinophaga sedimenti]
MKKLAILFSLSALLAVPASYVNARSMVLKPAVERGFDGKAFVNSVVFGNAYTYGNNMTDYDFYVTFTPVGTSGSPITYYMEAGFYNPADNWVFTDGVYDVKLTPVSAMPLGTHVMVNYGSAYIPAYSTTPVTVSGITFYPSGGNVVQLEQY